MTLLNASVVEVLVADEPSWGWAEGHGSNRVDYLGGGLLYYALTYMFKARNCVCLGSGGGFVPKLMAQAHRDLSSSGLLGRSAGDATKVVLVDANVGKWGRPNWLREDSRFRRDFPEVEILFKLTADAAADLAVRGFKIDYLHVDADHSKEGCLADLNGYLPLMRPDGVLTLHDSAPHRKSVSPDLGVVEAVEEARKSWNLETVNLDNVGTGTMVMKCRGRR